MCENFLGEQGMLTGHTAAYRKDETNDLAQMLALYQKEVEMLAEFQ